MERNHVVLVDKADKVIGKMEKMKAHREGLLHRAFSIFIFNDAGNLLLQQRASHKYHGAGLWTNTCCSHPQWDEEVLPSAVERLKFEMGIDCELEFVYSFIYRARVENNLIEHELDHVFVGYSNEQPVCNLAEVQAFKWMDVDELIVDVEKNKNLYTVWFQQALPTLLQYINRVDGYTT